MVGLEWTELPWVGQMWERDQALSVSTVSHKRKATEPTAAVLKKKFGFFPNTNEKCSFTHEWGLNHAIVVGIRGRVEQQKPASSIYILYGAFLFWE